jgi:aspartate racemase
MGIVGSIGVLTTLGAYESRIYHNALSDIKPALLFADANGREQVHRAIYDPSTGIKAMGQLSTVAKQTLQIQIDHLARLGARAYLLACTELPLAQGHLDFHGLPVIDPNLILARALVKAANPQKLKPLDGWE